MKHLTALCAGLAAVQAAPSEAATVVFDYEAISVVPETPQGILGLPVNRFFGRGSFEAPDVPLVRLSDLTRFTFTHKIVTTFPDYPWPLSHTGIFNFGLSELRNFEATFIGDVLASLAFETTLVKTTPSTALGAQRVTVTSLGANAGRVFGGAGNLTFAVGQIQVKSVVLNNPPPIIPDTPSAVPEPATWAMLILGFGLIGAALRRSRASTHRHASGIRLT